MRFQALSERQQQTEPQLVLAPEQLAEHESNFKVMKAETKKLFEQMKHIIQAQALQTQTCMRDIERLESQMDGLRSNSTQKDDNEIDFAKKIMVLERDLNQLGKEHKQDIHEIKQNTKDTDLILKNLRHQVEQGHASNEFKSQELAANQADVLQSLQLRLDQQERLTRKVNSDLEVSLPH